MQKNQYTKLIKNVFSDDSDIDKILEYFPVWKTTDEVSLTVLWILNEQEKELLEKYIEYKKGYIDSLDINESKEAKKIGMKLLRVISSFYDKIQSKERFWNGDFFYEKEQLIDKIRKNFHNPWLAFEYLLLSSIWSTNNSFYLAPQELESNQIDVLSSIKSSKTINNNTLSYSPSYVTWWQLTVSSNVNNLRDKLLNIKKTITKIDNNEIRWLRVKDTPDLISLIVVNGNMSNFIKAQTKLEKDIDNSFTKALNQFSDDEYYGHINNYLDSKLENITEELNIISLSLNNVEKIFDRFIVNEDLLKNHSSKVELETAEYSIESTYNKVKHIVVLKVYLKWNRIPLYEVHFFSTDKLEKKLKLNSRVRKSKKISSIAKEIVVENNEWDLLSYYNENKWLPSDASLEDVSTIYNIKSTYEEQIETFINYFKENNELQSWIALNDLIFLYKVLPESRQLCKNRIIWIVEWKNNFFQKIETLTIVYKTAPEYWDLKEYSFKSVEDISIQNWLLTKEAEEYWFNLIDNKINNSTEFKIQVFILWLKILTNHIIEYSKLKKIFTIIKKQTNLVNIQNNLEDLVDTLLIKMLSSEFIKNNDSEEIIDEMIFLYDSSCCSRRWKEIQNEIEKIYWYKIIKNFSLDNLKKLWNFNKESDIYINALSSFKDESETYNDYSYLINEIESKLRIISINEFIEEVYFLYNNSSNDIKRIIDYILFQNYNKHCTKNNLSQYFNWLNDYSEVISELYTKINWIKWLQFKSSSYLSIDEKEKLDDLKNILAELLNEVILFQKDSITNINQGLSFYKNNPSNEIINIILSRFVNNYSWLNEVYNKLSNNDLIIKEEIFKKMLKSLSVEKKDIYCWELLTKNIKLNKNQYKLISDIEGISIIKLKNDTYSIEWDSRKFKEVIGLLWWDKFVDEISWKLSNEIKDFITKLLTLYYDWVSKEFTDFKTIYSKLDKIINNFEIGISVLHYILGIKWNKKNKSYIKKITILLIAKIETFINQSSHLSLDGIKIINRLIQVNDIKKDFKINDEIIFEESLENNINTFDDLLYVSIRFKSYRSERFKEENEFIQYIVDDKLYLITNYTLWVELYEKNSSNKLLIKIIELSSNVEEIKNLYKYCKNNNLKEILLTKHIWIINSIYDLKELKEIYKKATEIFWDNTQKLEDILWIVYRNKHKIIQNDNEKNIELNLLLFIYKNTNDFSLKTSLINDIITNSNNFNNLYNIYSSIKNDNNNYIDNITKDSIISRMKLYIKHDNLLEILNKLLIKNEEELLYSLKEDFIKHSSTIKVYEDLKKYYEKSLKEDKINKMYFITSLLDRIKDKVIKNIKNINKLKIELEESDKSTQKKAILNRMITISDSFETLLYIYNVCNKNTFAKSYVNKTRKWLLIKLESNAVLFSDFEFLYNNSITKTLRSKFILKMKESISNMKDLIKLYLITNDDTLLDRIKDIINLSNYKEYFENSKKYPTIRNKILDIIMKSKTFKKLTFDELKDIYNKIRKKEEFKIYNQKLFVALLNNVENIDEYWDIITIFDNNSFLWNKSLDLLKNKIHKNILFFGKWFSKIDDKLSNIKSIELKDFILDEMDFYFKDISNVSSTLQNWEWNEKMVILRSKLIKKWVYLLQSMELLKNDDLFETFLYFQYIDEVKLFNNLLIDKLKDIGALDKTWVNVDVANNNLNDLNEYIISNWILDLTKYEQYKKWYGIYTKDQLEHFKKFFFIYISKNWNILKDYSDESKDELFHIIFNKTL